MKRQKIWKDVIGYEGLYMVSNDGDVKALKPQRRKHRKVISQCTNSSGYLVVSLRKNDKVVLKYAHTLVIAAFIPSAEGKHFTNHKNSIRTDNRVENLEWCTPKENIHHAMRKGRRISVCGERHHLAKLTDRKAKKIFLSNDNPITLARKYNISRFAVYAIKRKSTWKHIHIYSPTKHFL